MAPKGFLTEKGRQPGLASLGLVEHDSPAYPPRTEANVKMAQYTVLYTEDEVNPLGSPGSRLTATYCRRTRRPLVVNPGAAELAEIVRSYSVINFAGTRGSRLSASRKVAIVSAISDAFSQAGHPLQPGARRC